MKTPSRCPCWLDCASKKVENIVRIKLAIKLAINLAIKLAALKKYTLLP
jgi:hypothetical protein